MNKSAQEAELYKDNPKGFATFMSQIDRKGRSKSMTNEMLAQFIQEGGNDELIPILWEKVRKLLYVKADRFYSLYKSACDGSGVDVWDIRQASYSAFLDAVKAYKAGGKIKFTSYLNYPFKNAVQKLLGIRVPDVNLLTTARALTSR